MLPDYIIKNIILVIIACILIISLALFLQYKLDIKVEKFIGDMQLKLANYSPNQPPPQMIDIAELEKELEKRRYASRQREIDAAFNRITERIKQTKLL